MANAFIQSMNLSNLNTSLYFQYPLSRLIHGGIQIFQRFMVNSEKFAD